MARGRFEKKKRVQRKEARQIKVKAKTLEVFSLPQRRAFQEGLP